MWIMTKDGFFSIVQHKDMPWMMMVRARVREDLVNAFGEDSIVEDGDADYRFRKSVHRDAVKNYMANSVDDVDYVTSVKDRIDQKDPDRHRALYAVWRAFYTLQCSKYGNGIYGGPMVAEDAVYFDESYE